jgi:choline kinase
MRQQESLRNWYLSVVNDLAQKVAVQTVSIEGLWWSEIDSPEDLDAVRGHFLQNGQGSDTVKSSR